MALSPLPTALSKENPLLRYGGAVLAVTALTLLRWLLDPILGRGVPFILFFPAVMLSGWIGGLGPGLLATALSTLAAWYLFLPPELSLFPLSLSQALQLALFTVLGALISLLLEALHRSRLRVETAAREDLQQERSLRQAQEEAQQEEARTAALFHQVLVGVAQTDLEGRFVEVNERFCAITGRPRQELLGLRMQDITHADDLPRNLSLLERLMADGEGFVLQKRYVRPDGSAVWVENSISPVRDANGTTRYTLAMVQDITERRQDEEEVGHLLDEQVTMMRIARLLAAELDLERLVQVLTDEATAVTGAGFGAFFYNVIGERGESYTLYSLSGVPREAFASFPMPRNTAVFGPTFRGEGIVRSDDILLDPRYGKNAPYSGMPPGHLPVRSYLAAPVVSRSGEVMGGLFLGHPEPGVFDERAERILSRIAVHAAIAIDNARLYRQAREARTVAEAANRSKDEFLATVSHELRTPLNAMLGWAQLLQASPEPDRLRRGLETIIRNARLQTQLIDDLLDVSRIISGKMRLDVRTIDLVPVIEAAVEAVRPAAEARQIRLVRLLDPQAGPVAGDSDRLQQVVWNLLANAVRFTPKGGRVEIRLEQVNSHVEMVVADTGIGIRQELLSQVFDRFLQADSSTTRQHGGLGLGLAIVRHLVELHGGTVEAHSPGEGQGATFVVRLPLSVAHLEQDPRERVHPRVDVKAQDCREDPSLNLRGVRVLVVDDEADARETLIEMLAHCDAEVVAAGSAGEALALLPRFRPHVLLCDIGMPEQDGYALIRQVRELPAEQGGTIPAAALTAYARGEDRRRALLAGFQMHLTKPVQIHDVTAVVASLARGVGAPSPP